MTIENTVRTQTLSCQTRHHVEDTKPIYVLKEDGLYVEYDGLDQFGNVLFVHSEKIKNIT